MKSFFIAYAIINLLLFPLEGWTQEEKELPSQKTREAMEKFKKAPSALGKSLEALQEAGKAKLQEMLGRTEAPTKAEPDTLTMPTRKPKEAETPRYSPAGKRDPFRALALRTKAGPRARANFSPLERFEIGQLKLVGIVWDAKDPKAMVEDTTGLGYIVKIGTPIGDKDGKVKTIRPTEVVIEEIHIDPFGAKKVQERRMKLPGE
ncbi:MAG: pilus assembly protein PilP [Candidatus Binatia bacterium]